MSSFKIYDNRIHLVHVLAAVTLIEVKLNCIDVKDVS